MSKESTFPYRSHQMGLSLVELMISLAIALILMIALTEPPLTLPEFKKAGEMRSSCLDG